MVSQRSNILHDLKGNVRRLKLILDEIEKIKSMKESDLAKNLKYFNDFEKDLEVIKNDFKKYKNILLEN